MSHVIGLTAIPPRSATPGPIQTAPLAQTSRPEAVELCIPGTCRRFPQWCGTYPKRRTASGLAGSKGTSDRPPRTCPPRAPVAGRKSSFRTSMPIGSSSRDGRGGQGAAHGASRSGHLGAGFSCSGSDGRGTPAISSRARWWRPVRICASDLVCDGCRVRLPGAGDRPGGRGRGSGRAIALAAPISPWDRAV